MLKARLRIGAAWRDACILDLSSRGLLIQADEPLRGGNYVELRRGRHVIVARVMWASGRRCGLYTQDSLPTDAIIAEPDKSQDRPQAPQDDRRVARAVPRPFDHERSRWRGRSAQFCLIALAGTGCGAFAYSAVSEALSRPLFAIETALASQ